MWAGGGLGGQRWWLDWQFSHFQTWRPLSPKPSWHVRRCLHVWHRYLILRCLYSFCLHHYSICCVLESHQHAHSLKVNPAKDLLPCPHVGSFRRSVEFLLKEGWQEKLHRESAHVWKELYRSWAGLNSWRNPPPPGRPFDLWVCVCVCVCGGVNGVCVCVCVCVCGCELFLWDGLSSVCVLCLASLGGVCVVGLSCVCVCVWGGGW